MEVSQWIVFLELDSDQASFAEGNALRKLMIFLSLARWVSLFGHTLS